MQKINDIFEDQARDAFAFLESEYKYQLHEIKKDNYGCFITYKGHCLAVKVNLEFHDAGMAVYFYKLKDGKIPQYPIFFDPAAEFLVFHFNDVLRVKAAQAIKQALVSRNCG